ncbi:SH3 domain-containing protein [Terrisporobacter vanillatitrophus]|uniref:SH3 domain-containing protein n=1 Tax=Terrisporobacter vanillatitrophus TaxID=3058402 RepID=UPI003368B048
MNKYTKSFLALSLSFTIVSQNVMIITNAQETDSVQITENASSTTLEFSNLEVKPITKANLIGEGIVNASALNVRSGPSTSYEVIGTLTSGTNVEILDRSGSWYKISYNNTYGYVSGTYITLNPVQLGIDVSKWNYSIDWDKVKASGVDYAIIRAGYGSSTVDPYFYENIRGAIDAGIEVGVYWFSYATNSAKAKIEAQKCIETIAPYKDKISYPVFFDFEYASVDYAVNQGVTVTKSLATSMSYEFLNYVESQGYMGGVYTNDDFGSRYFSDELLSSSYLWVAQYSSTNTYPRPYMMWQYTDKGTIEGIGTSSSPKYFDMNYTFLLPKPTKAIDLSNATVGTISQQEYTGEEIKPSVTVSYNGKQLVLDKDYQISYSNNISVGTATAKITGIGDYTGSITTSFGIVNNLPDKVTGLTLKSKTTNSLTLSWTKVSNSDGYEIYKYDNSTGSYKLLKIISGNSNNYYTDSNLKANTSYTYKVRAYKMVDSKTVYGEYSSSLKGQTDAELSVIKTGTTKSGVNVRSGPSTSYAKVGYLNGGTKVEIVARDSNTGWYKIKYNNGYAYVSDSYVSVENIPTTPVTTTLGITKSGVNVRSGPSTSYAKVGYLNGGTKVEIVGTDSKTGWYKIKYNNGYAYVSDSYVRVENIPTTPVTTTLGITKSGVNVRSGPSTSYAKVGYLNGGTKVEIVGTDSKTGWYKIKYNNGYAYASNLYITKLKIGTTKSGVNIRRGPSTSYAKVGYLNGGTKVEIVGTDSKTGWYKILYNSGYAYVSNLYVTITK